MSRRKTAEKENSYDKKGDEAGVPPAGGIDENTGKEDDRLKENGDGLSRKTSGESDREQKKGKPGTKNPQKPLIIFILVIIVAILLKYFIPKPNPPDFAKIFANKIVELQSSFTNQTDRFWRVLEKRGLAHLKNASLSQPLVLLLAAPPAAHGTVDCLARKLAAALDPQQERILATIDGREERSYPGEETKKKMDDLLIRSFKTEGHRAALVHHLELLPLPSPLLFYSYCDDQNAPHKHVAIIFTVHLPVEPDASLEPKEAEGTVEKYLTETVWAKEGKDAVAALLSRVADTVALMNGEPSSLDTC